MTVYVDTMRAKFGRMIMCHMLADSEEELHAMADRIGVARRWHQKEGTEHSHYDICLSKRAIALKMGAVEADRQKVVEVIRAKRARLQEARKAWKEKVHCQNGGDVCLAGSRDGICCPEDSCDIENGTRK